MRQAIKYISAICISAMLTGCGGSHSYHDTVISDQYPQIWPNYTGITIPAGIAPVNFNFTGHAYSWLSLKIRGSVSGEMVSEGKYIDLDIDEWHSLTEANKGGRLQFELSVIYQDKRYDYKPFQMLVSQDPLDEYGLTYRLVEPGYVNYSKMGIYERNLSNFEERTIFVTTESVSSCVNCHTSNRTNAEQALFHVRGRQGYTLLKDHEKVHALNMKTNQTIGNCVYPYWHPDGRYVAFSQNLTFQMFHASNPNKIEVYDQDSDLGIYDVEKQELILSPQTKVDSLAETFPAFAPDGKTLYYCRAPKLSNSPYIEDLRYCLMRADFDPESGKITGEPDTLLALPDKSISFPRPSYDGRYLMFTACDYGTFPIWHHEADLYMIDLQCKDSVRYFPAEALNSNDTESFHNWSANSKWVVISSRREDGLYTRLYIAHAEKDGSFSKPFMLPQRNPAQYYNNLFFSYNTPDFCDREFDMSAAELRTITNSNERESIGVRE